MPVVLVHQLQIGYGQRGESTTSYLSHTRTRTNSAPMVKNLRRSVLRPHWWTCTCRCSRPVIPGPSASVENRVAHFLPEDLSRLRGFLTFLLSLLINATLTDTLRGYAYIYINIHSRWRWQQKPKQNWNRSITFYRIAELMKKHFKNTLFNAYACISRLNISSILLISWKFDMIQWYRSLYSRFRKNYTNIQ